MTVETPSSLITYTGNNATTIFSYSFIIPEAEDAIITLTDITDPDNPVDTILTSTQYTITGLGDDAGGTVTYPISGSPIDTNTRITIQRVVPITQEVDIVNQGSFNASVLEGALDKLTMICQQLDSDINRAVLIPIGATEDVDLSELIAAINAAASALALATSVLTPCTASGVLNALALTPVAGTLTSYINQSLFTFKATTTSTSTVTINISGLGAKKAYLETAVQANANDILTGVMYLLIYDMDLDAGNGGFYIFGTGTLTLARMPTQAQATVLGRASGAGTGVPTALTAAQLKTIIDLNLNNLPRGYLSGCNLSNNAGDATNDIDISTGSWRDSTNAVDLTLASALIKRSDATWVVGTNQGMLDTGVVGNSLYYVFIIGRTDLTAFDILSSLSATAPTMPPDYTYKRRIGSFRRLAGAIKAFTTYGDLVLLTVPIADAVSTVTTARTLVSTSVPAGMVGRFRISITNAATVSVIIQAPFETDAAPSFTLTPGLSLYSEVGAQGAAGQFDVLTNASAQIAARASAANTSVQTVTIGWLDTRGRFD